MHSRSHHVTAIAVLALAVLLFAALPVQAAEDNLGASKDNTLYEDQNGNLSNGAGDYLFAGITQSRKLRRGLIAFDVSGIPAGSTISDVTLTLYMSRSTAPTETIALHAALADWGEGASNATAEEGGGASSEPGDATWLHTFYNTSFWASQGGDFNAAASATTGVDGPCEAPTDPACGFYTWGSTPGLVADVQNWVDGAVPNHGWVIIGREVDRRGAKRFNTRENPDAATRPVLTVTYTSAAQGACCVPASSCQVLSEDDCLGLGGSYQGDSSPCTPDPCIQPSGACCAADGGCTGETAAACVSGGGTYQGDGISCTPNPCPQPIGACCADSGLCTEETEVDCVSGGGAYEGDFSTCGATECPVVLTPYLDPLPLPGAATPISGTSGGAATYDLTVREFQQQLHSQLPPTTVWGYDDGTAGGSYPGPTIEAAVNQTVVVHWNNDLRELATGLPRTDHYLDVDTSCIHGAENLAKIVTHLHGAHVSEESDGYPEFTYTPGFTDTYTYPNGQLPGILWYHDHALGITRLNVYMGMAGYYLLRDSFEQSLNLPSGEFEVPLAIQDRKFNPDGTLQYPAVWQDHFFGDKILVNGKVWPYLEVKQGKYRFRLLEGSSSRFYSLSLVPPPSAPSVDFTVIGTEGGLLEAPVPGISTVHLGPGERLDTVVDFSAFAPGDEILLENSAPAPFPNGTVDLTQVMKFIVVGTPGHTDPLPVTLRPREHLQEAEAVIERDFRLRKGGDDGCGRNPWLINGLGWDDITEYPELDTIEVWRFINDSGISHPMHMHLVMFQILDRDTFTVGGGGEIIPDGNPVPPPPEEAGWKDTAIVDPGELVRVIARFENFKGRYAYHCHILEHEDHEMMRQFQTVRCGDAELDPSEGCDDGARVAGDGCSAQCQHENAFHLSGSGAGGSVILIIDGVTVNVPTLPSESPADVIAALVTAINNDAALTALGVTALQDGDRLVTNGSIDDAQVLDGGLTDVLSAEAHPDFLWWATTAGATAYDVVQGSVGLLNGGLTGATQSCAAEDTTVTSLTFPTTPLAPGEGLWFLIREVETGVNGTYDTGLPSQVGLRDGVIAASGNDCL